MSLEGQHVGRYALLRLLGSGGMGEVYLAQDSVIQRQIAIKMMRADVTSYSNATTMQEAARLFLREARAIAMLDHPHILPLYDYGETTLHGTSITYLVMPYRPEGSLTVWLHQRGSLQDPRGMSQDIVPIVSQAADALQHAHDHQIIHQDVKPANFLVRSNQQNPSRPDVLLADFGVARLNTATASGSSSIRGTPAYTAPEQLEGHAVPATDQYALAIMTYELLTGRPPFQGGLAQVMYQHIQTQPIPPSTLNPHVPADVDTVILRALAKKPEERFPSISAFAHALQEAMHATVAGTLISKHTASRATPAIEQSVLPSADSRTRTTLSKSKMMVFLVLTMLVIVGSIGFISFSVTRKGRLDTSNATVLSNTPTAQNPYAPTAVLALNDPLRDNSQGYNWQTGKNQNNATCTFVDGAYQSTQPLDGDFHACLALATNFSDFVYEVEMTMVSGYGGGIIFRANQADSTFYYFRVSQDGSYDVRAYVDAQIDHSILLTEGSSPAIQTGYGHPNLLAVVAQGSTLAFYANHQLITRVSNSTYSYGQIGVVAYNQGGLATVVYRNAKVWRL
ncbi:MAG: serine/threonine protein kinase [Ktedonobacteraceae bacterium]|nr:serine/threonine protein kinase [Ktedonobacteraceae bacterium]